MSFPSCWLSILLTHLTNERLESPTWVVFRNPKFGLSVCRRQIVEFCSRACALWALNPQLFVCCVPCLYLFFFLQNLQLLASYLNKMDQPPGTVSPTISQSLSQKTSSDSFEDVNQSEDTPNSLYVEEDHFSIHSDIDFLEDVDLRSVGNSPFIHNCLTLINHFYWAESKPGRAYWAVHFQIYGLPELAFFWY